MEPAKKTIHDYKTLVNMNKNLYFSGGYSVTQLLFLGLGSVVALLALGIWGIFIIVPLYITIRRMAKNNKKGYPDIWESWEVEKNSPKYIFDKGDVFPNLIKDEKN